MKVYYNKYFIMMGSTQSRDCERFSHWLVFSLPKTATATVSNSLLSPRTIFAIRGLMPVIYFKFISQLDDSEYQKTSDHPRLLSDTVVCQVLLFKIS
jgi:hypothetical protein